jgi:FKBP-type peptidyl-prolyl cis-trans isomerase
MRRSISLFCLVSILAVSSMAQAQVGSLLPLLVGQQKQPGINELKKMGIEEVKIGTGPVAQKGDQVYMIYRGYLKSGLEFDSNMRRTANPFSFILGEPMVIEGWQRGILGMRVGGKRKLSIPDELGYGPNGSGEKIPPNADLYFEVELLDIVKKGEESYYDRKDLKPGAGRAVKDGDLVEVNYTARLVNGKEFDKRMDPKATVKFRVAAKKVQPTDRLPIIGIREAIKGMKIGGVREIKLPPALAFANAPAPNGIPNDSIVIYTITLRRIL